MKRVRLWISAMICVATRAVIALHVSPEPPSMRSAVTALEMATRDKTEMARRLGCQSPWDEGGSMEMISVDSAAYFAFRPFRVSVNDAGIDLHLPRAGDAPARGHIERWFQTLGSQMFNFFDGRTWSNPAEKGNYDSQANAAATADLVAGCMIRWVVDCYHNTPHSELNWATPRDRWLELSREYGVIPGPTGAIRTHLFGTIIKRKLSKKGLRNAGLSYQSKELQHVFRESGRITVTARVNNHNLGAISVWHKGAWMEVPCPHPELEGVTIWQWLATAEHLRLFNAENANVSRPIMMQTFAWLKDQAELARLEAGLASPVLTSKEYDNFNKKMDRVFELTDNAVAGQIPPEGEWRPSDELFAALNIQPVVYAKTVAAEKAAAKAARERELDECRPEADLARSSQSTRSVAMPPKKQTPLSETDEPVVQRITDIFDEE